MPSFSSPADALSEPWASTTLPALERANLLLAAMTFEDKVNLVMGDTAALAHLRIPSLEKVDASGGLRGDTGVTAFPIPLALAATFNSSLAYDYGAAIGAEARAHGWSVILGPTVDVERRGNSGRLPEGYGEDPLLNGVIGERVSRGMQDQRLITNLKHFSAYNQEKDRNTLSVRVSERALHERYNAPFYHIIKRGAALSIMGAYPRINGTYACENAALMDGLRAETGWHGFMLSDFLAGEDPVAGFNAGIDNTTLYPNFPREAFGDGRVSGARLDQAAQRTLFAVFASGLYELPAGVLEKTKPVSTNAHKALAQRAGEQSIVLLKNRDALLPLDKARLRTLAVIGCAGRDVITGPEGSTYVQPDDFQTPLDAIARAAGDGVRVRFAQGSHGDHPLPVIPASALTTPDGTSPGLLGAFYANADFAGEPVATQIAPTLDFAAAPVDELPGGWSARWRGMLTAPRSGWVNLSVLCSGSVKVFIDGRCVIAGTRETSYFITNAYSYPLLCGAMMTAGRAAEIVVEFSSPFSPLHMFMGKHLHLGWQPHSLLPEAVAAAAQADAAVVWVNQAAGEGMDRDSFGLPGDQNALIEAVCAANPNTVVVLNTSGAVLMPWLDRVAAVLQVWYPGEVVGTAPAAVLFGDAEPGGRLPITFPATEEQTIPAYAGGGAVDLAEGVFAGYRHFMRHAHTPLFAFGHGLSYTTFEYSDLGIAPLSEPDAFSVRVRVRNSGTRSGSEVVQAYVGELPAPVPMPARQLAGFAKVTLGPGEAAVAEIVVARRSLSYWDESAQAWATPAGRVNVFVGGSLADERLRGAFDVR